MYKLFLPLLILFLTETTQALPLENAVKEVMRMTENGLEPKVLKLKKLDSSVFFLNTTKDSLATIDVNFGQHDVHCASENVKLVNGVLKSIKPIAPRDFALMCFPEQGSYQVTARGLDGTSRSNSATIIVE